jgi:hypothetical protein
MNLEVIIATVAATALMGAGGAAYVGWNKVDKLQLENAAYLSQLQACNTRVADILEDVESDNEVDRITDPGLVNVPDGWLVPETGASPH